MATIDLFSYSDKDPRVCVPRINFGYLESDTGNFWVIWASVAETFLYRLGDRLRSQDIADRKFDSQLMVRRLEASLLIAKKGLFKFKFDGMWTLDKVEIDKDVSSVNCVLRATELEDKDGEVADWFQAFSKYSLLRRAAEDAYMASILEQESIFFLYRGFEWLKKAVGNVSWNKLGDAIDIPQENIKYIKKTANDPDAAARHAAQSGFKSRFEGEVCSSWVCGLFHSIAHVRCDLDPDFNVKVKKNGNPWPI